MPRSQRAPAPEPTVPCAPAPGCRAVRQAARELVECHCQYMRAHCAGHPRRGAVARVRAASAALRPPSIFGTYS